MNRRHFISIIPAGFATSFLACKQNKKDIIPLIESSDNLSLGDFNYYSSAYDNGLFMIPLVVKTFNGRPIQITANVYNSLSNGLSPDIQTSVITLYNPKRQFIPKLNGKHSNINAIIDYLVEKINSDNYAHLWVLQNSLNDWKTNNLSNISKNSIKFLPVISQDILNQISVTKELYGISGYEIVNIANAELIISSGNNFLTDIYFGLLHQRNYAKFRENNGKIINIISNQNDELDIADENIIIDIPYEKFIISLNNQIEGESELTINETTEKTSDIIKNIALRIKSNIGKVVVLSNPECSKTQRINISLLNYRINAYDNIIKLNPIDDILTRQYEFENDLSNGKKVLILDFANKSNNNLNYNFLNYDFLKYNFQENDRIIFSSFESNEKCLANIPLSHFLEYWNLGKTSDDHLAVTQQIVQKLNRESTSKEEFVFELKRRIDLDFASQHKDYYSFFKESFGTRFADIQQWNGFLKQGIVVEQVTEEKISINSSFNPVNIRFGNEIRSIEHTNIWLDEINSKLKYIKTKKFDDNFEQVDNVSYTDSNIPKWGMIINSRKCSACGSCLTACMIENNISCTGEERIKNEKDLHWIEISRYILSDGSIRFIPIFCQHCDNAPCERVCPVGATSHSPDGINEMTYNRCVGTRYCMANCPYGVRKFNYSTSSFSEEQKMTFNPNVTVRSVGVSEKCTFCIQRLRKAEIKAKLIGKKFVPDQTLQTACQEACPSSAIVFGNLHDPNSIIRNELDGKTLYQLKGYANTKPSIYFTI